MTIARIEILDHKAFGEMVVKWSQDPASRPTSLEALKAATAEILSIPPRITDLKFVDVDLATFVIRIPNKDMVAEAVAHFQAMADAKDYPVPGFYGLIGHDGSPPALDILFSRIADYTIGQCQ